MLPFGRQAYCFVPFRVLTLRLLASTCFCCWLLAAVGRGAAWDGETPPSRIGSKTVHRHNIHPCFDLKRQIKRRHDFTATARRLPMAAAFATKTIGSGSAAMTSSALGFGCMGLTAFYGKPLPDDEAVSILRRAAELGATHWDTAEVYRAANPDGSTLYNESVVGRGIAAVGRDAVQIASKYMPSLHGDVLTADLAVEAARASCDRLGIDSLDLYYVHRMASGTPVREQAAAMNAVKKAGLTRFVGVSEFNADNLREFHAVCPVTCVQQEWSLMNRDLEEDLVPVCRELGIGIVAYSPLCRSLLAGEVKAKRDLSPEDMRTSRYGRFQEGNLEKNALLVGRVADLAERRGVTPAQLSLSWVCNLGADVVPIPGTTKLSHLEDNVAAAALSLDAADMEMIAAAVPQDQVAGDRFANDGNKHQGTYKANPW